MSNMSSSVCIAISRGYFFFLPRSGTTVVMVGITAPSDGALEGDWSFFGFLASLVLRWPFGMVISWLRQLIEA